MTLLVARLRVYLKTRDIPIRRKVSGEIGAHLQCDIFKSFLDKLSNVGFFNDLEVLPVPVGQSRDSFFSGKTFVLTGTLAGFTRAEAKQAIEARGGKVTTSLSRTTSALIVGSGPGSKLTRAQRLGVPILEEAEFLAHLGD